MKHLKIMSLVLFLILCLTSVLFTGIPLIGLDSVYADVKISQTKVTLSVGESQILKVTGTSKKVTWSSSDNTMI